MRNAEINQEKPSAVNGESVLAESSGLADGREV